MGEPSMNSKPWRVGEKAGANQWMFRSGYELVNHHMLLCSYIIINDYSRLYVPMCLMVNQYMIIIFPSCFIKLISAWYLPIDSHTDGFVTNEETIIIMFFFHTCMLSHFNDQKMVTHHHEINPNGPSLCLILSKCLGVSSGNLTMSCGQRWMIYLLCVLSCCISMLNWLRPTGKSNSQRAMITND